MVLSFDAHRAHRARVESHSSASLIAIPRCEVDPRRSGEGAGIFRGELFCQRGVSDERDGPVHRARRASGARTCSSTPLANSLSKALQWPLGIPGALGGSVQCPRLPPRPLEKVKIRRSVRAVVGFMPAESPRFLTSASGVDHQ